MSFLFNPNTPIMIISGVSLFAKARLVRELMKNLWKTIDDPRVQVKERTKAMKLMLECYNIRFQIIDSQTATKEFMEYPEKVKIDEQINAKVDQELERREKVLQHYLEKNDIDFDKIDPMSQRKF